MWFPSCLGAPAHPAALGVVLGPRIRTQPQVALSPRLLIPNWGVIVLNPRFKVRVRGIWIHPAPPGDTHLKLSEVCVELSPQWWLE